MNLNLDVMKIYEQYKTQFKVVLFVILLLILYLIFGRSSSTSSNGAGLIEPLEGDGTELLSGNFVQLINALDRENVNLDMSIINSNKYMPYLTDKRENIVGSLKRGRSNPFELEGKNLGDIVLDSTSGASSTISDIGAKLDELNKKLSQQSNNDTVNQSGDLKYSIDANGNLIFR